MLNKRFVPVVCALALSTQLVGVCQASTFTDVPETHWASESIEFAAEMGYVSGIGDGTFAPDATVSNAEFVTMVNRVFYSVTTQAAQNYVADDDSWWLVSMENAYIHGILSGTTVLVPRDSDEYEWDDTVTAGISRYDMAQIIYNVMDSEYMISVDSTAIESAKQSIADWSSVPSGYQNAVATCYAMGIITGTDDAGTFSGTSTMTRAQAAVVLCRMTS